jgi:AraC-like DNA-binding protein
MSADHMPAVPMASGAIARLAMERLEAAGQKAAPILKRAGLRASQLHETTAQISTVSQIKFLEAASEVLGDDLLGFHLALNFELRQIGLIYYIMASSDSLDDAFTRASRYSAIVNEGIAVSLSHERGLVVRLRYVGVSRHSDRHQVEFWMTSIVRVCRRLTGRNLSPKRVCFAHHRSKGIPEFSRFLGCPVQFQAKSDEILLPPSVLSYRLTQADPYLNDLLVRYAQEALAHRNTKEAGLRAQVENAIAPLLPHGAPSAGQVAAKLGMSQRTLARRLAAENLTLGTVLAELRADLAPRYLRLSNISIAQVAWLLGYKEASAFTHAFKMRTGRTPTQARSRYLLQSGQPPPAAEIRGRDARHQSLGQN